MLEIILFTSDFVGKPPSPSVNPRKVGKAALTRVPLLAWSCAASATGTLEGERSTSDIFHISYYSFAPWVYILPNAQGGGVGIISFFFMNSRQDQKFLEKIACFG